MTDHKEITRNPSRPVGTIVAMLLVLTMIGIFIYLMVRTVFFFTAPYLWQEKIVALLLLCGEGFLLLHSFGYFLNTYHVLTKPTTTGQPRLPQTTPRLAEFPPVAIIVSSYKEPLAVIEDTLICFYNLTYPNKNLYFLDDTRYDVQWDKPERMQQYKQEVDALCERIGVNLFRRRWRGAKAGMINDFLRFIEGEQVEGFEFIPFSTHPRNEREKYIIVFDADMNPFPDFVETLVAAMEESPRLAFIQTPQYYSNFESNRVARASGLQQAVFYEYICEGKSQQDAMFCCGTNVIFRREALMDVGGFDESSVTEDFATSLKFHIRQWSSAYLNKVSAFGMGPEDLGGYFKQQFRWALGTVGIFRALIGEFCKGPGRISAAKWWEYFLSSTHYFVWWVFLILVICPVLYLFFNMPSFFAHPEIYVMVFLPYFVLSLTMFASTLMQRRYRIKDLLQGVLLTAITFPVFIKASTLAMLGVRGSFGITPKDGASSLPFSALWPQLTLAIICFSGVVWGLLRFYYEHQPVDAILVNTFWSLYHFLILSSFLYFNHPEERKTP